MGYVLIPKSVREVDAAWLTRALIEAGCPPGTQVESVGVDIIGEGEGIVGELARLTLGYVAGSPAGPRSLIAKAPTAVPEARAYFNSAGLYATEAGFYRDLASRVPLRTPHCYFNGSDLESGDFLLLLEDLAPSQTGDQVRSCSEKDCDLAVADLARLHAAFWRSPALDTLEWLRPIDDDARTAFFQKALPVVWPKVVEKADAYLGAKTREIGALIPARLPALAADLGRAPATLLHGDYRLDNLMFGRDDAMAVIDWQVARKGRGASDLAYFVVGNLTIDTRRRRQAGLVSLYLHKLAEGGINEYGHDDCWRDFRAAALLQFGALVLLVSNAPNLADEHRGVTLWRTMLQRTNAFIEDTDFDDVLSP